MWNTCRMTYLYSSVRANGGFLNPKHTRAQKQRKHRTSRIAGIPAACCCCSCSYFRDCRVHRCSSSSTEWMRIAKQRRSFVRSFQHTSSAHGRKTVVAIFYGLNGARISQIEPNTICHRVVASLVAMTTQSNKM